MKPIVFAGPSLYRIPIPRTLEVDIEAPAKCGDILEAVASGRKTIGLIDGKFEQGPAVWHKEILEAINAGCSVFGASSMGALRAAELAPFGMIGVGKIYEDYVAGRRVSDADVAMVHGPAELGHPPLSLSLVDLEEALERLKLSNPNDNALLGCIREAGRRTFFKDRTWDSLLSAVIENVGTRQQVRARIGATRPMLKTRDALMLLERVNQAEAKVSAVEYTRTCFIEALLRKRGISL